MHAQIPTRAKCKQAKAKYGGHKGVQRNLLVCRAIEGHLHKQILVFCHNFLSKAQHQNPPYLHISENFVPLSYHEFPNLKGVVTLTCTKSNFNHCLIF